ncbi:MAG: DinB family protein [Hellea sp.]
MTLTHCLNETCPWSGDPVSVNALTRYRNQVVGFCNPGCRNKFDKAIRLFDEALEAKGQATPLKQNFLRLADYNSWMNQSLYARISTLRDADYRKDAGAFFKSVHGTLNHILVWDTTWLQRFTRHEQRYVSLDAIMNFPKAKSHDQILFDEFDALLEARVQVDSILEAFVRETREADYEMIFTYVISTGESFHKPFGGMIQHLLNHQTHHRGQITTLLSQMGVEPGITDLLERLPDLLPEPKDAA